MIDYYLKASRDKNIIVNIIYSSEDKITQRYIRVFDIKDGYVKAFCYLRNKIRLFKLENILSAEFVKYTSLKQAR